MTAAVLSKGAPTPQATIWLLGAFFGLLTLATVAEVQGLRGDRETRNQYLLDGFETVITDGFGRGITLWREHRWDLVVGNTRVPLTGWMRDL